MESIVNWFVNSALGQHVSREVLVFIVSLFPILEMRGGLLAATLLDVTMWKAVIIAAIGNFIPIPFILLFVKKVFAWLKKTRLFRPFVEKLENRALGKRDQVEKYTFWGLALFVGIPLPGTGAWTGSLIAALIDMDFKKAIQSELVGLCLCAVIMTFISYGVIGNIIR